MTLLATDAADNVILAFFDLKGTKHNKKNHEQNNTLALYAINLDNLKVVGPTYFNESFDKMDMQHHNGKITAFGITSKHHKSDLEFNVKSLVFNSEMDYFEKNKDAKFIQVEKAGSRERICPVEIHILPVGYNAVAINSNCRISKFEPKGTFPREKHTFLMAYDKHNPDLFIKRDSFNLNTFDIPKICITGSHIHAIDISNKKDHKTEVYSFSFDDSKNSVYRYPVNKFYEIN